MNPDYELIGLLDSQNQELLDRSNVDLVVPRNNLFTLRVNGKVLFNVQGKAIRMFNGLNIMPGSTVANSVSTSDGSRLTDAEADRLRAGV